MRKFTFRWLLSLLVIMGFAFNSNAQVLQDFEGGFLPSGWVKELGATNNDVTQSSTEDHTTGSGNSMRFSSYNSASDYNQYVFSRKLTIEAGNTELRFWHKKYNTSSETLEWGVSTATQSSADVTTWTAVTLDNTQWVEEVVDLSAYVGQDIYFAWHYYGNYLYYVYVDDVLLPITPSSENDILTYSFPGEETGPATINNAAHSVDIEVAATSDITSLTATFTLSDYASAAIAGTTQESGVTVNDFTNPVTYDITAEDGTIQTWTVTVTQAAISSETNITAYSFTEETGAATINDAAHTVDIEVNWQADLTNLTADFILSAGASAAIGGTAQVSGTTANDFTNAVTYDVTAEDGTTIQPWTITVTQEAAPAGATCGSAFAYTNINDPEVVNDINADSREMWFTVVLDQKYVNIDFSSCPSVYDTKLYVYDACGGSQLGYDDDAPNDYCSVDNNQSLVEFSSLDAGTYYVKITPFSSSTDISTPTTGLVVTGDLPSTETDFLTFSFPEQTATITPDVANHTIDIEVGNGTDLSTLTATFTLSAGATDSLAGVLQVSGSTVNDYTNPVVFNVVAEDGTTTQDWTVTVTEATINTETDFLTFSFPEETASITPDAVNHTIDIEVNWQADITNLIADFTLSYGATDSLAGVLQVSGTTANDYTNPVIFKVVAEDGTTIQDWTVTVTLEAVPAGATCATALPVNLPTDFVSDIYQDLSQTNTGLGNWNDTTSLASYDGGEDIFYELTVTNTIKVNIELDPKGTTWTGIGIYSSCPGNSNEIAKSTSSSGDPHGMNDIVLAPGSYYIMIDTWPTPDNIPDFDLTITNIAINTEANILTYSHASQTSPANINATAHTVDLEVGNGTDLTAFVADFTLSDMASAAIGGTAQVSGTTANDFSTSSLTYTVTAEDGTTTQDWTVTVTEAAVYTETDFLTFSFPEQTATVTPDATNHTIDIEVGACVDVTALVADFTLSYGATDSLAGVLQVSGTTANDYTNPVIFKVVAEDGTTIQDWTVTVTTLPDLVISSFPYFEGFEGITMPNCWTILNEDGDANEWTVAGNAFYEGVQSVEVNYNSSGNNDWLITPQINITEDNLVLDFYAKSRSASFPEDYNVLVSTTGTNPADFTTVLENITSAPDTWIQKTYNLTDAGLSIGDNIYIAIQCVSTNEWTLYIDAFSIHAPYNTEVEITSYDLPGQESSNIDATNDSIMVIMPSGTTFPVTLAANFVLSTNATAVVGATDQVSGTTENTWNDNTTPVDYIVTAEDGTTTKTWHVYVDIASGINTVIDSKDVTVYPNPNNGQFNIALNLNVNTVNMEIVNMQGQVVANFKNIEANTTQTVNLNNVANGMYYIRISSDNETIIKKVNIVK